VLYHDERMALAMRARSAERRTQYRRSEALW
jgi:hypothetical protein